MRADYSNDDVLNDLQTRARLGAHLGSAWCEHVVCLIDLLRAERIKNRAVCDPRQETR